MTAPTLTHPLPGGVPLLHHAAPSAHTTTVCLAAASGARDEGPATRGATHLLEHLLMGAPAGGDGRPVTEAVDALGGECNGFTSKEALVLWARVPAAAAARAIDVLAAALCRPTLPAGLVERERRVVVQELRAAAADPASTVHDRFFARLYPGHGLGAPLGGTPASLAGLDAPAVAAVHRAAVRTRATVSAVAVGGDGRELAAALAGGALAGLPAGDRPVRERPVVAGAGDLPPVAPGADYAYLCLGGAGAARGAAERAATDVLNHLLGPSGVSLLYRRLRTALGLAYQLHSWHSSYSDCGSWRVLVGTEPGCVGRVRDEVLGVLDEVAAGRADPAAVEAARAQAVGRALITWEDPVQHAQELALGWYDPAGDDPLGAELAALAAVSPGDVRRAAARVLDTLTVAVAPAEEAHR